MNFGLLKRDKARPGLRFHHRIIGVLGLLAVAGVLQACSVVKLAYNQAPDLAYWYLDTYLDLTGEQSLQVKASLSQLQAWHRQTQLPVYITALQQLQQQLPSDTTAAAACAVAADVRSNLGAVAQQAESLAAGVAVMLQPGQLRHLAQKFAKTNAEAEDELQGNNGKTRQGKRYRQLLSRAESLYGTLDEPQRAVIARRLEQSRFDLRVLFAERQRRQRDMLQTLQPMAAGQVSPAQAKTALRGLVERTLNPLEPVYRRYLDQLGQENCQSFAELHNSTTPAQRGKAVETLRGYEQDFRILNARTL
ncbi:lipoprotein, putative [Polaromonas sp. CG9_12]|nr:lipoprotein, putative [Polaromonas sp. CG9_12]